MNCSRKRKKIPPRTFIIRASSYALLSITPPYDVYLCFPLKFYRAKQPCIRLSCGYHALFTWYLLLKVSAGRRTMYFMYRHSEPPFLIGWMVVFVMGKCVAGWWEYFSWNLSCWFGVKFHDKIVQMLTKQIVLNNSGISYFKIPTSI